MAYHRKTIWAYWGLYLLSPFIAALIAIKQFHRPVQRKLLIGFSVFFAFVMVMSREGMDGYRHAKAFIEFAQNPWQEYGWALERFSRLESGGLDLYLPTVKLLVGIFTDDPRWFFALNGLVFGFFYVKTIGLIFDEFGGIKKNLHAKLFFFLLIIMISINHIHFVRFWTAAWVYLYCVMQLFIYERKRYLWLSAFAILIHFSYALPVSILFLYFFIAGNNYLLLLSMVALFFASQTYLETALGAAADLGEGLQHKVSAYTNEEYLRIRAEGVQQNNWYARWRGSLLHYYLYFTMAYLLFLAKYQTDAVQRKILGLALLIFSVSILASEVWSIGRFSKIAFLLTTVYLFRNFMLNPHKRPRLVVWIGIPIIFLYTLVEFRSAMDIISPMHFIGNFLVIFFPQWEFVLRDIG
jgi:hypothetical protein